VLCVAEIIWCLGISYSSIDVVSDVVMVDISDIEQHLVVDECYIYMSVDLAEASSRVLVDTALWFTVSEARDWSDSRAWPPFCLARQTTDYVAGDPHVLDVRFVSI